MAGLLLVIVVAVAAAGLFSFNAKITSNSQTTPIPQLTQTPSPTSVSASPTPTPLNISPTFSPPVPTSTIAPSSTDWSYPGSRSLGSGIYESSSDTDSITEWYQNKIKSLGYNVRSFVKTSANDKILNKLAAAKSNSEISIEISKNPGDSVARIIVLIDN